MKENGIILKAMAETPNHPLTRLSEDDLNMIQAFVLVSGSIKDLAGQYGVSYPTMRQRLNRLIERLKEQVQGNPCDPLDDYLADLIAKGQITAGAAKQIRELHRRALAAGEAPAERTTRSAGR
jgi:hypothetical protein